MGCYLTKPVKETQSEDDDMGSIRYGASSMQGWRVSQEDAHNCLLKFDEDKNTSFFAVYDGHGGAEVAQYTAKYFPEFLKKSHLYADAKLTEALEAAFLAFDATLTSDKVLQELKEIAGVMSDDEEDVKEEKENLQEEANMPLNKLLEKYYGRKGVAAADEKKQFQSPALRAKRGLDSQDNSDVKIRLDNELLNGHAENENNENVEKERQKNLTAASSSSTGESRIGADDVTPSPGSVSSGSNVAGGSSNGDGAGGSSSSDAAGGSGSNGEPSGSSDVAGGSSSGDVTEAGSSSGRARKKRKGVIPTDSEDESSFEEEEDDDDDEWDTEEEEEVDEPWKADGGDNDDEDDDDDEDSEMPIMGGGECPGLDSGCTAVAALLREKTLYVANAGDSRCVVCRAGEAVEMSFDHKPEDEPERARIVKAGGKVTAEGRVNGGLNLSRAIGDHIYKKNTSLDDKEQMITALPDVKVLELEEKDEFVVLACDGIWNVLSSQDVVKFVSERLQENQKLSAICEEMFEICLAPNTTGDGTGCDNMTAIIVDLRQLCSRKRVTCDVSSEPANKRARVDAATAEKETGAADAEAPSED